MRAPQIYYFNKPFLIYCAAVERSQRELSRKPPNTHNKKSNKDLIINPPFIINNARLILMNYNLKVRIS